MKGNMKFTLIITILCVSSSLSAHNSWIDCFNQSGKTVIVKISNGHSFPESIMALKDKIITYCKVVTPNKRSIEIKTKESKRYRLGRISISNNGTYIVTAALKNPPRYFLKSIFVIGDCTTGTLESGELFEIVPGKCPGHFKKGASIPLQVLFDGKPVATSLSFSIDGKRNFHSNTDRSGRYQLKILYPGKYLITASHQGKVCSLTFEIK